LGEVEEIKEGFEVSRCQGVEGKRLGFKVSRFQGVEGKRFKDRDA
jgi:hypothetical protein